MLKNEQYNIRLLTIDDLKQKGYVGVRIMVNIRNVNAINLYIKLGFFNCGEVERFNQRYYLLELRL